MSNQVTIKNVSAGVIVHTTGTIAPNQTVELTLTDWQLAQLGNRIEVVETVAQKQPAPKKQPATETKKGE